MKLIYCNGFIGDFLNQTKINSIELTNHNFMVENWESQNILKGIKEISIINFDHNDVIRHPLVSKIVEAYKKNNHDKG